MPPPPKIGIGLGVSGGSSGGGREAFVLMTADGEEALAMSTGDELLVSARGNFSGTDPDPDPEP